MGGQVIKFGKSDLMRQQIEVTREQNVELRNSNALKKNEMLNSFSGLMASAGGLNNITSLNPLFQANVYAPLTLNRTFLSYFYSTHGIIQTAIDQPVLDALSAGDQSGSGVMIRSDEMDEADIDDLQQFMEDEGIWEVIGQAKSWARLFGGGAIIINEGGKDLRKPLPEDGPIHFLKLYAADRWELSSTTKLDDPNAIQDDRVPWDIRSGSAGANEEFYVYYGQQIHRSRVITLNGITAPSQIRWQLQGWGMSEVQRMVEDFNMYLKMNNVIYDLLNEAKVDVFMVDGFRETMMTAGGEGKVLRRMQTVQQAKNMNNALVMDKNDVYDQKQIAFAGLSEMKKEVRMGIASAVKMPVSKIFGVGATGFSSGEDDLENYNATVQSTVRQPLRKPIRQVIDLIMRLRYGAKFDFSISYKPLRIMSAKDEEDIKDKKFARVTTGYQNGLVTSQEWGDEVHKEHLLSVETAAQRGEVEDFPEAPLGSLPPDNDDDNPKESKEK